MDDQGYKLYKMLTKTMDFDLYQLDIYTVDRQIGRTWMSCHQVPEEVNVTLLISIGGLMLPSRKLTWLLKVAQSKFCEFFQIESGDFPVCYVKLPEGTSDSFRVNATKM